MFYRQIQALSDVGSLTAWLFTEEEQAHNHCQVGNIGLQLKVIVDWLDTIDKDWLIRVVTFAKAGSCRRRFCKLQN